MSNGRLKGLGIIRPEEDIVEDVLMGEICFRCPCGSVWPHYLNVFAERHLLFLHYEQTLLVFLEDTD